MFLIRALHRGYKLFLSPLLVWVGGPGSGCRFEPSCSDYMVRAIEVHGICCGSWLGVKRIGRCHPWGGEGFDPVPPPTAEIPNAKGETRNQHPERNDRMIEKVTCDCPSTAALKSAASLRARLELRAAH